MSTSARSITREDGWTASTSALFAFAAWALSALHYATFFDLERPIYTDVRYFLYFAWRIAEGDVAHLEVFDNKTFLANFVGAGIYRAAQALGLDPLQCIRASMLALASFGGLLAYWVFRRIGRGSPVAGFLGLLALLSFAILGELPAIGNFPKLLMGLLVPGAALAIARGRWFLAGLCGALAFMDWQIGALVGLSAVATALLSRGESGRNAMRVIAGGVVGLTPFVVYFAAHGALGAALDQTFGMALARASESMDTVTLAGRLEKIAFSAGRTDPGQRALMLLSLIGLPLSWAFWWRLRQTPAENLLLALCLTHTALFVFNLNDFQRFGDFYVLSLTLAFWLGITWTTLYFALLQWTGSVPGRQAIVATAVLVAAVLAARPLVFRPGVDLSTLNIPRNVTLSEQRALARDLDRRLGEAPFLALGSSEILFLMRRENPLPIIYLNVPSHTYEALSPNEPIETTAGRLIDDVDPNYFIYPGRHPLAESLQRHYTPAVVASPDGSYRLRIYERNPNAAPAPRP